MPQLKRGELRKLRENDPDYVAKCLALYLLVGPPPKVNFDMFIGVTERRRWLASVYFPARKKIDWGDLKAPPDQLFESIIKRVQRAEERRSREGLPATEEAQGGGEE